MKYLRLSLAVGVLSIGLATSALAGEIPYPGVNSTGPATSIAGEMPLLGVASIDPVTEITLNLVQSMLSLF